MKTYFYWVLWTQNQTERESSLILKLHSFSSRNNSVLRSCQTHVATLPWLHLKHLRALTSHRLTLEYTCKPQQHAPDYNSMKEDTLPVTNTCTIPREMRAGFPAHTHTHKYTHTCSHIHWKNTKGLSEQPWSRHTQLPPANLFISAPVSQLRPTWHTARLSRFKTTHDVDERYFTALQCEWRPNKTCLIALWDLSQSKPHTEVAVQIKLWNRLSCFVADNNPP